MDDLEIRWLLTSGDWFNQDHPDEIRKQANRIAIKLWKQGERQPSIRNRVKGQPKKRCLVCRKVKQSVKYSWWCRVHVPEEIRCQSYLNKGKRCRLPVHKGHDKYCKMHIQNPKEHPYGKLNEGFGWVYLFDTKFTVKGGRLVKIGMTNRHPERREYALQAANPFGEMLFAAYIQDPNTIERYLHRKYGRYKWKRELFALSSPLVQAIETELREKVVDNKVYKPE